ncbi:MAG: hypothetical protein AB1762_19375 [Gemmatimonadota bacterium]
MPGKTQQLQIRVTPRQKTALKRQAVAAGIDVSTYVLSRVLPSEVSRFADILRQLQVESQRKYALAELNELLSGSPAGTLSEAIASADVSSLSPFLQNYVAAMVEQAAELKHITPPAWLRDVAPLDHPHFATPLISLRMHLMRAAPVPFKRRNIFVDSSLGARV